MNKNTPQSDLAIDAVGVSKAYRRGANVTSVLTGVDLQVAHGECLFLVGPSGSGKSTLLSILACILTPDQGNVRILGSDISQLSNRQRTLMRRERIGFVFQRFHLIRGLSALENVSVPLILRGQSHKAARGRSMELLEAVGLNDKAASSPANLSVGQCQRIALARALVGDPELIFADEPTASLDAKGGQQIMTLLRELITRYKKTAVIVTHDHRIFSFADRICQLDNGRVFEDVDRDVDADSGQSSLTPSLVGEG